MIASQRVPSTKEKKPPWLIHSPLEDRPKIRLQVNSVADASTPASREPELRPEELLLDERLVLTPADVALELGAVLPLEGALLLNGKVVEEPLLPEIPALELSPPADTLEAPPADELPPTAALLEGLTADVLPPVDEATPLVGVAPPVPVDVDSVLARPAALTLDVAAPAPDPPVPPGPPGPPGA